MGPLTLILFYSCICLVNGLKSGERSFTYRPLQNCTKTQAGRTPGVYVWPPSLPQLQRIQSQICSWIFSSSHCQTVSIQNLLFRSQLAPLSLLLQHSLQPLHPHLTLARLLKHQNPPTGAPSTIPNGVPARLQASSLLYLTTTPGSLSPTGGG